MGEYTPNFWVYEWAGDIDKKIIKKRKKEKSNRGNGWCNENRYKIINKT